MTDPVLRSATPQDAAAIDALVQVAFGPYVARIGRRPAPMDADYRALIAGPERVEVLVLDGRVCGALVTSEHPGYLDIDCVVVGSEIRGRGWGRFLLAHAEDRARAVGLRQTRGLTNAAMTENLQLYPRLGYREVERRVDRGFHRVFFVKDLDPPSGPGGRR